MPKLPGLTSKDVIRILTQRGFILDHATGSHYIYYHAPTKCRVTVPFRTRDLPKGTLMAILKQAGISREEL